MNHVVAKTKNPNAEIYKLISGKTVFTFPNGLDKARKYNPKYKLEEEEWFYVDKLSEREYQNELLEKQFIPTDYSQMPLSLYNKVDYLCSYQDDIFYFQNIIASQFLRKKFLSFSDVPALLENQRIIVIDDTPDAIYNPKVDILYFQSLSSITTIFKGIDILYKTATDKVTKAFLENKFIKLENGYSFEKVKTANRKRITMVTDKLKALSAKQKKEIFDYIKEYCTDLVFNARTKNFSLASEHDLKNLIYGIDERFYTTIIGGEKRLANSIIPL